MKAYAEKCSEGVLSQSLIESMSYATSRCSKWYNKGIEDAGDEYLWWIDLRMKKNLLLDNGKILPVIFRNIVSIAAISKNNPQWMERFIERYSPLLPDSHRESNLNFALGLYSYKRGKYKEAVRYFMTAQAGEEVLFNSVIRRWQFMCLYNYDSQDIEVLFNHLSSFEKYLQRHSKQLSSAKSVFDKFIDYSQQLLRTASHEVTEPFMILLKSEEHFPGKPWLVQQFEAKLQTARVRIPQVKVR